MSLFLNEVFFPSFTGIYRDFMFIVVKFCSYMKVLINFILIRIECKLRNTKFIEVLETNIRGLHRDVKYGFLF